GVSYVVLHGLPEQASAPARLETYLSLDNRQCAELNMNEIDWICESCKFINSDLLPKCEVCGALREKAGPGPSNWSAAGPHDPIVLSDSEESTDAEVSNKDIIDLVDDDQGASAYRGQRAGPGQGSVAAARNRLTTRFRDQRDPDITIINDDDDCNQDDEDTLTRPGPAIGGTQPTAWHSSTSGIAKEASCLIASGEAYSLDTCNCTVGLQHLAEQLRPAVAAAAMILSSAKPAVASATVVPKSTSPSATLFDLTKSLLCPSAGCGRWLSSRDVRLLLGPFKTAVLYYALCTALRREGKDSKEVATTAVDGGGDAALKEKCAAGHSQTRVVASGAAARGTVPNDAVAPLLPLAPSCPVCRRRMLPVCALDQSRAQLEQTPPSQLQQPMPAGRQSQHQLPEPGHQNHLASEGPNYHTALEQGVSYGLTEHPTTMAVQLREALAARGRPLPPPTASVDQLCSLLRNTLGQRCSFLCLGCPRNVEDIETLPKTRLQELQSTSDQAFHVLKLLGRVRAVLLSAQEHSDEDDEEGNEEGRGSGSTRGGRRGGNRGGCKRRRVSDRNNAWAKGVGYGGGGGSGVSDNLAAVKAAQERQRQADDEVRSCLKALLNVISPSSRYPGGGGGSGSGRALASPPPLLHAVLQYGGLPYLLRLLFQNDSLLDMGQREGMYREALALVKCFTTSMSLLELLVVPASDPRDTPAPGAVTQPSGVTAAGGCGAGGSGPGSDQPLSTIFESLGRRCSIFKRSAQELADGAAEDISALGLALELGALADEVAAGVSMWQSNVGKAPGALDVFLQLPDGTEDGGAAQGCSGDGTNVPLAKQGHCGAGTAGVDGPSSAAADALNTHAAQRSEYVSVMRPLQFREVSLLNDHYFRRDAESSSSSAGGDVMRRRLKRITGEISGLATGLPLDWEASAFVAVDDNRVDVLRALVIPASDTPYANGAFIFDIYLPPEYPNLPPKVQFLTTAGGRVRFNPNLYNDGKVCLSLLGTWAGPSWDPAMSTILQVLVSIQSMILVSDPYYNEPGWESQANTAKGRQAAGDYANIQRYNTLAFSILPALEMVAQPESKNCPLSGGSTFRDVLAQHFRFKRAELLRQCDEWMAEITASANRAKQTPGHSDPQESSQEKIRKYTEVILPRIKSLLQNV
ncbi:hypothetical protein Vretifemale_7873, partial [Volvox reticuliferus]